MTNRELIEYLRVLPPDSDVWVHLRDKGYGTIQWVYSESIMLVREGEPATDGEESATPEPEVRLRTRTLIHPQWKYIDPKHYWESMGMTPPRGWEPPINPPDGGRSDPPGGGE